MTGIVFFYEWEIALMAALQSLMGPVAVTLAGIVTMLGEELVVVGFLAFFYFAFDKEWAKRAIINVCTGLIWGPMIKNIVNRRRPYFDSTQIKCLKPVDADFDIYDIEHQGFSFPSGHSITSATFYPSIAVHFKRKITTFIGIVIPLMVGISRFCLGVHYPTDVLAGWALGAIIVFGLEWVRSKGVRNNIINLIVCLTGVPGLFYVRTSDFYDGYGILLGAALAFVFEEKYVNFEKSDSVVHSLLRVVIGLGVFLAISKGLKLFLPDELAFRLIRYAAAGFVSMGPAAMVFRKLKI